MIKFYDEEVKGDEPFAYVDPKKPWKKMEFKDVDVIFDDRLLAKGEKTLSKNMKG